MKILIQCSARIFWGILLIVPMACHQSVKPDQSTQSTPQELVVIRYDYKPKQITEICNEQMKTADKRILELLKTPKVQRNFENTIEKFEEIMADLYEQTTPVTFMYYVSLDKTLRTEAEQCEAALGQYAVGVMSRRDIYDALVNADELTNHKGLDSPQSRLVEDRPPFASDVRQIRR